MFRRRKYLFGIVFSLLMGAGLVMAYRYQFAEEEYHNLTLAGEEALHEGIDVKVSTASTSIFSGAADSSGQSLAAGRTLQGQP